MSLEDLTVDQLLARARAMEPSAALFNTLVNNPETREEALKLVRRADPKRPIPELDASEKMEKRLEEERAERAKLEERIRDGEIRGRLDKERARVMKQYTLDDAEMLEVEKIMTREDAPIPHYDAAAKVYKAEKQLAKPTTAAIADFSFKMPEDKRWAKGIGSNANLNRVAMEIAAETLNEVRGGKAA